MAEQRYQPGDEPIPGFMLRRFLGKGNFGEVWEARAAGDVKVAMKILSDIDRKSGRKAFKALQLVKNLNYPHLVTIVGFWLKDEKGNLLDDVVDVKFSEDSTSGIAPPSELDDANLGETMRTEDFLVPDTVRETPNTADRPAQLFIAMGLAEETLDQCMARHQKQRAARGRKGTRDELNGIPRPELLRYLEGAAKGLDFLNIEHSIQHGDVKPANIMIISGEGQVSDFDLAQALVNLRATASTIGTLAYMAPEVFDKGVPTPTSDQYALAITYYEMRTGKLPYSKEVGSVVIHEKVAGRLDLRLLPKAERKVIRKASSIHPSARYHSCVEMIQELRGREMPVSRFLKYAAVFFMILTLGLGAWQYLAPERMWRPGDLFASDEWRQEKFAQLGELIQKAENEPETLTTLDITNAFGLFDDVLTGVKENEKPQLTAWNAVLMDVALGAVREKLVACTDNQAAADLRDGLLQRIQDFPSSPQPWLTNDDRQQDLWRWELAFAEIRIKVIQAGLTVRFQEFKGQLSTVEKPSAMDPTTQSAFWAFEALAEKEHRESDLLVAGIVGPLAKLCAQDPDFHSLTDVERKTIAELQNQVRRQTDERIKAKAAAAQDSDGIFEPGMAQDLETISGIRVALLLKIMAVSNTLEEAASAKDFAGAGALLVDAYDSFRGSGAGPIDSQQNQTALDRIEELELLLFLKDPESQSLLLDNRREGGGYTVADQLRKLLTNRSPYYGTDVFCHALLRRAEAFILNDLKGTVVPLADVEAIFAANRIEQSLGNRLEGYQHWLGWIRGVANINPQNATYQDYRGWETLLRPFPDAAPLAEQISPQLAALVGLCQTECLAVEKGVNPDWRLSPNQRQRFEENLSRLNPDNMRAHVDYYLFCKALYEFAAEVRVQSSDPTGTNGESADTLLLAVKRLGAELQDNDGMKELLRARPKRLELCTQIVLTATLADSTGVKGELLESPFVPGGADAACTYLRFACDVSVSDVATLDQSTSGVAHSLEEVKASVLRFAAAAAFFKEEPDYASAAAFSDQFLLRFTSDDPQARPPGRPRDLHDLAEVALINARSHIALAQVLPETSNARKIHVASALRSYAVLADWFVHEKRSEPDAIPESTLAAALDEAIEHVESSSVGPTVRSIEEELKQTTPDAQDANVRREAKPPSDGADTALLRHVAHIYAARASLVSREIDASLAQSERDLTKRRFLLVAVELDPRNVGFLLDYAVACLAMPEIRNNDDMEIAMLKDITQRIAAVNPDHPGKKHLEGWMLVAEARRQSSTQEKTDTLKKAIDLIGALAGTDDDEFRHLLRYTRATASFELANQLKPVADHRDTISSYLHDAIADCEKLENHAQRKDHVYLLWGHALEDLEYLVDEKGNYEVAIGKFEQALDRDSKPDAKSRYLCVLGIARSAYRLSLAGRPPMEGHDLASQVAELKTVVNTPDIERDYASICAECYLYMGRISTDDSWNAYMAVGGLARVSNPNPTVEDAFDKQLSTSLKAIDEALLYYSNAVQIAYSAKVPFRYEWKLEYAEAEVDKASICGLFDSELRRIANDTLETRHRATLDREKSSAIAAAERLASELLASDLLEPKSEDQPVVREHALVALSAIVKVMMAIPMESDSLDSYVQAAARKFTDADLKCHLTLKHALFLTYSDDVTEDTLQQYVNRAQVVANEMKQQGDPRSAVWLARIHAVRAIAIYKPYYLCPRTAPAAEKAKLGVAAMDALQGAVSAIENAPGADEADLVWLRYSLGVTSYQLFCTNRELKEEFTTADLGERAVVAANALNKVQQKSWDQRSDQILRKTVRVEYWDWGRYEKWDLNNPTYPIAEMLRRLQALKPPPRAG